MRILGLSAFRHDSAAAVVEDGVIVAAAQEERFSRKKHDSRFPRLAVRSCLAAAGFDLRGIDLVVFYDSSLSGIEALLRRHLLAYPGGEGWNGALMFVEHRDSLAASAFFPSPFDEAAILTLDGGGTGRTTIGQGHGTRLSVVNELSFPHSLGLLYSAFTSFIGFKVNSGEYKTMGLAPYGEPRYVRTLLDHFIDLQPDGTFRLAPSRFDGHSGTIEISRNSHALLGGPPRRPDAPLSRREMDLAASVQAVTEMAVLGLAQYALASTSQRHLCLSGGGALNCVANGKLLRAGLVERLWVQPAAGEAGGAIGAALYGFHHRSRRARPPANGALDRMRGALLGPAFTQEEIERDLDAEGARFEVLDDRTVIERTADALARGRTVGWMQGPMEFGPRALGNRSILADPRAPAMQQRLNLEVKRRESFRPFAPAVLREDVAAWFEFDGDSPYMLLVAAVAERHRRAIDDADAARTGFDKRSVLRSDIPAVTHVDYSARLQTVHRDIHPRFHELISAFKARTGCPVLVNTSFNVRGEPIVCTAADAFRCFMGTGIDLLVAGNCFLEKDRQDMRLISAHSRDFAPD